MGRMGRMAGHPWGGGPGARDNSVHCNFTGLRVIRNEAPAKCPLHLRLDFPATDDLHPIHHSHSFVLMIFTIHAQTLTTGTAFI